MTYRHVWRAVNYPVDAETAYKHFEEIDRENGQLTPALLLESSRPADSVMHTCFEWNDTVAAEKYRLKQAHGMIANMMCVPVVFEQDAKEPEPIRAWHSVSGHKDAGVYRPLSVVANDTGMRAQILENALKDLKDFERKYAVLGDELGGIMTAIDETVKELSA